MAGKSTTYAAGLLGLIFQAVTTAGSGFLATAGFTLAQNGSGTPATVLYVSLHTADPEVTAGGGTLGTQNASEAAYSGYTRISVVRTSSGWSLSGTQISNVGVVTFPISTSGPEVETFFGIGLESSGANPLLYSGALTSSLTVNNGITPSFAAAALQITES